MLLQSRGILFPLQKEILVRLGYLPDLTHFYLAGGTALAEFYLGHRKSFDLDIFSAEEGLIQPFSRQAVDALQKAGIWVEVVRQFSTFVELSCMEREEQTKVQFALDSPFRLASVDRSEYGISVSSLADLTADKLLAFTGRVEPRDAVDLFFLLEHQNFPSLQQNAKEKDPGFDLYWFAMACAKVQGFPDDLNRWPVEMVSPLDVRELKQVFQRLGEEALQTIQPDGSPNSSTKS